VTAPATIAIDAGAQGLIGDALCAVPFMRFLCERHKTRAYVHGGFNEAVRPLLGHEHFVFANPSTKVVASYKLDLDAAWHLDEKQGWRWHMSQIYFEHAGVTPPPLPMLYAMHATTSWRLPGIVLTPFSRTNSPDNNKLWPHDRWIAVLRRLIKREASPRAYIVGAEDDDMTPYLGHDDLIPFVGHPLPEVLGLLRDAPIVLGLDNGISHLCHFGGIRNHVEIYADCLPPHLAENPMGVMVRGPMPIDITVEQVLAATQKILPATRGMA